MCKKLSPVWAGMDTVARSKYVKMHEDDKKRYLNDKNNLSPDDKYELKQIRNKKRRTRKKNRPRQALSPYMFLLRLTVVKLFV